MAEIELSGQDVWVLVVYEVEKECLGKNESETDDEFAGVFGDSLFQKISDLGHIPTEGFVSCGVCIFTDL